MFWRLHKAIFGDRIDEAIAVLEQLNDSYQIVEGLPSQLEPVPFDSIAEPVLAMTTLQDAQRLIRKDYPSTPWLFFNNNSYKVSYWLSRIDQEIPILNRDCIFLPFSTLKNFQHSFFNNSSVQELFIKPDSGNKVFTGFTVLNDANFLDNVEDQLKVFKIEPEEMCVVCSSQTIEATEWRFWIAERKIIAYTPYSWDDEPELQEPPQIVMDLAIQMTENKWQPDYAYVADFCIVNGQSKLIEINAASTSGIYNANIKDLFAGLRSTSIREYNLDIE